MIFRFRRVCRTPFREPLQFIVMSVMVVMSVAFPHTYRGFLMTVVIDEGFGDCHFHRPSERHGENGLDKRLSQYYDGDDGHDGPLRVFSRRGSRLYFRDSLSRFIT